MAEEPIEVTYTSEAWMLKMLNADHEVEFPSSQTRPFAIGNSRLYMLIEDLKYESPVRQKIHQKKLFNIQKDPSDHKKFDLKAVSNIVRFSSERDLLKKPLKTTHDVKTKFSGTLSALKTAIAADIKESKERVTGIRSKKSKKTESVLSTHSLKHYRSILSVLEANTVVVVFEKMIEQLAILKTMLPECWEKEILRYQSIEERFGKEKIETTPDMDKIPQDENLVKLQRDRKFIAEVLQKTLLELLEKNSYLTLSSVIINKHKMEKDEEYLVAQWPVMRARLREARAELHAAQQALGPQALARALLSVKKEEELGDTKMLLAAEERYVDNWEAARRAQQATRNGLKEREFKRRIDSTTLSVTMEARAGYQTMELLLEEERRLKRELDGWERRRFADLEQINDTIIKTKHTLEQAALHTEAMRQEAEKRERELEEWRARKAEEFRQKCAAERIQRSWRAHAYRRLVGQALASARRGRLLLAADAEETLLKARASVRTRIAMQRDHEKHLVNVYIRAFTVFQALLGVPSAQQELRKEAMAMMRGKKGKKGKKGRK